MTRSAFSVLLLIMAALGVAFAMQANKAGAQSVYSVTLIPRETSLAVGADGWITIRVTGPQPDTVSIEATVEGADAYGLLALNEVSPQVAEGGVQFTSSTPGQVVVNVTTSVGLEASAVVEIVGPEPAPTTQGEQAASPVQAPLPPAAGTGIASTPSQGWPAIAMVIGLAMVTVALPLLLKRRGKQEVEREAVAVRVRSIREDLAATPRQGDTWPD